MSGAERGGWHMARAQRLSTRLVVISNIIITIIIAATIIIIITITVTFCRVL